MPFVVELLHHPKGTPKHKGGWGAPHTRSLVEICILFFLVKATFFYLQKLFELGFLLIKYGIWKEYKYRLILNLYTVRW